MTRHAITAHTVAKLGAAGLLGATLAAPMFSVKAGAQEIADVLAAVVSLEARVPANARTAETLGTTRVGSGALIDGEGLVLTVGYLILEASEVSVAGPDGRPVPAKVVAYDQTTGFGLVRALGRLAAKPLRFGSSAAIGAREAVIVVARGDRELVTAAEVVSRRTFAGPWEYLLDDAIFTVPPHPHFGGAALIGRDGALLGIGSLIVADAVSEDEAKAGNMFVPIDALKPILADLVAEGRSRASAKPWLGIFTQEVHGHLLVTRVSAESPAEESGIEAGDFVLGVGGEPVGDLETFYRKVYALGAPGVEVPLDVLHGTSVGRMNVRSTDRYAWLRLKPSH